MLLLHKQLYLIWKEIAIKLIYIHEQIWMAVYPCSITHLTDQGFIMVNPFLDLDTAVGFLRITDHNLFNAGIDDDFLAHGAGVGVLHQFAVFISFPAR
jgi:hypothetical protein